MDLGVRDKTFVGPSFDPMIAKVTAYGNTRLASVNLLKKQLQNIFISGLETNINLLVKILNLMNISYQIIKLLQQVFG